MEFKGKQRAEEYASEKSSSLVFKENHIKDYINGYKQALEDSKAKEMLEMIKLLVDRLEENNLSDLNAVSRAKKLVKQATEL